MQINSRKYSIMVISIISQIQSNNVKSGILKYECTIDPEGNITSVIYNTDEILSSGNDDIYSSELTTRDSLYTLTIRCDAMMSSIWIFQPIPVMDIYLNDDSL